MGDLIYGAIVIFVLLVLVNLLAIGGSGRGRRF